MKISELFPLLKQVFSDPRVIGTTIVVIFFMNFSCFVANYRKKPPKPKVKKTAAPAPAAAAPADGAKPAEGESESNSGDGNASAEKK